MEVKLGRGPVTQIFYQNPVFLCDNQIIYYKVEIQDDEDLQNMFSSHEYSGYDSIELYIILREPQLSHMVDPLETEQAEVDVVDEEEEDELEFDDMVNDDF